MFYGTLPRKVRWVFYGSTTPAILGEWRLSYHWQFALLEPTGSVFKIQMSFESIQIQIQIQIPTFELAKFRFIESEFVELIQNRPIQIQS